MKALTVRQPYAHLIAHHGKWVENRSKPPPKAMIGERIAIHAGLKLDVAPEELFIFRGGESIQLPAAYPDLPPARELVYGAVIATARIDGWVEEVPHRVATPATEVLTRWGVSAECALEAIRSEWWIGPFGWVLSEVLPISPPSPCKGALGLWELGRMTDREVAIREEVARAS